MNEFLITLIFIVILVSGVYFYAGYLTRTGKAEDADGNFMYDEFAVWFKNSVDYFENTEDIKIDYLSIQNEPNFSATYHDAGQFIFGNKKAWMEKIPLIDGKNSPVFIARERVQDIDNELDWDYAEKKGIILASES